jgi:hypothetical protein
VPDFDPLEYARPGPAGPIERARAFYESIARRRTVREFSAEPLPDGLLEWLVHAAGTAPSGALPPRGTPAAALSGGAWPILTALDAASQAPLHATQVSGRPADSLLTGRGRSVYCRCFFR